MTRVNERERRQERNYTFFFIPAFLIPDVTVRRAKNIPFFLDARLNYPVVTVPIQSVRYLWHRVSNARIPPQSPSIGKSSRE